MGAEIERTAHELGESVAEDRWLQTDGSWSR
jgi:hypothetical protein